MKPLERSLGPPPRGRDPQMTRGGQRVPWQRPLHLHASVHVKLRSRRHLPLLRAIHSHFPLCIFKASCSPLC